MTRLNGIARLALTSIMLTLSPAAASAAADAPPAPPSAPKSEAKIAVQVSGRVKNAGDHALDDGARLSDALAAAGTFGYVPGDTALLVDAVRGCAAGESDLHRVFLIRASTKPDAPHLIYQIDVAQARERHDLRYDPVLRQGDKIVVPECRPTAILIAHPPHPR